MWKKIILWASLVILVSFVLFVYNEFNGNPVSKYRSEKALQSYLTSMYSDNDYRIHEGFYDFKFKEYYFKVTEIGSGTVVAEEVGPETKTPTVQDYSFTVHGFVSPKVRIDGIRVSRLDHPLMERLGKEAGKDIYQELQQTVGSLHKVEVTLEALKEQFDANVSWDRTLPLDRPYHIFIVLDASDFSADDVYEAATEIQSELDELGYKYERVTINANIISEAAVKDGAENGYVKYGIGFDKGERMNRKDVKEF
ncbi:DUF3139 domain-containing protein [Anaerobacillus sp. CMMVII]|uniref:DUF3139 domain-containing protein n=1 Tax=Anaerobacillus sp. CMMVII TaxID=2755588 RepID=UPI0021B713C9|nr:DUF3139 domain-containing protein [Anaerobacillus sp. CMMVII]MCT8139161.1 DUF3139 domain-containing protein [Anaerobacillus sp. CMMVII]